MQVLHLFQLTITKLLTLKIVHFVGPPYKTLWRKDSKSFPTRRPICWSVFPQPSARHQLTLQGHGYVASASWTWCVCLHAALLVLTALSHWSITCKPEL